MSSMMKFVIGGVVVVVVIGASECLKSLIIGRLFGFYLRTQLRQTLVDIRQ